MNPAIEKRLLDAASACSEVRTICAGHTRESYLDNRVLKLAVWKLVEIVGEALYQADAIDPTLGNHIPELRAIIGTRHRIVHNDDRVNFQLLWDIVQEDIPGLEVTLRSLVQDTDGLPPSIPAP